MLLRLLIFTLFLTVMGVFAQTPTIETGVPQTLAKWRAANYSDVRYKLNLTLEKMSPTLKGTIEISLKNNADQIVLDWRKLRGKEDLSRVENVFVNEKSAKFEEINEHLVFKEGVRAGENVIKLDFTSPILTSGGAITRYVDKEDGAEYIYSLFVPSDASTAFPVFDQPDLKALFTLEIVVPVNWKVITNSEEEDYHDVLRENLSSENQTTRGKINRERFYFKKTKPISTYVFAFAAGDFEEFEDKNNSTTSRASGDKKVARRETSGTVSNTKSRVEDAEENESWRIFNARNSSDLARRFTSGYSLDAPLAQKSENLSSKIYVRKSQAEKFKQHAAETFRLNREAVKYLAEYFDYKFPFPKYDLVLIPEFPFGGMEHAGATFLREDRVIFPTEPTKNDFVTRANLIFHEAAHQWFGDTVTMRWFDDFVAQGRLCRVYGI